MSVLPSQAGPRHPDKNLPQTPRPGGRAAALARRVRHALLLVVIAGALAFAGGFFWFVARVPAEETSLDRQADARCGAGAVSGGDRQDADRTVVVERGARTAPLYRIPEVYRCPGSHAARSPSGIGRSGRRAGSDQALN